MKVYEVYIDYQFDRVTPHEIEYFKEKQDAIDRFNELKNSMTSDWETFDEYDEEDITDVNKCVLFTHKGSGEECYIEIYEIEIK